jgi:hypothetical protein
MRLSSLGSLKGVTLAQRLGRKYRQISQGRLQCFKLAASLVRHKKGIEIGGPTAVFQGWRVPSRAYGLIKPLPIYDEVGTLDNCVFASTTIWANHVADYRFSSRRPAGKTIIADGSALNSVADQSYDFVLSSHNLEHFANPVKALMEWKRITRPKGALILALPHYRKTFDRNRSPTLVDHMFDDYARNIGEDDTTHLEEVLRLHDLAMDGTLKQGTLEELTTRSIDNFNNRILHHHVFDEHNSAELLTRAGLEVLAVEMALPFHTFIVARWKE